MAPKNGISEKALALYDELLATQPGIERKGASMPYTSIHGHMFSFLSPAGVLGLRLPDEARAAFIAKHRSKLCEQHGAVLKEYVEVPARLLRDTATLAPHLAASYAYVSALKPKPTKAPATSAKPGAKKAAAKRTKR